MAMAVLRECKLCGREYTELTGHRNPARGICHGCDTKTADALKIQHFENLDNMPIEKRLRRLEIVQYNNSLVKNTIPYDPHAVYG